MSWDYSQPLITRILRTFSIQRKPISPILDVIFLLFLKIKKCLHFYSWNTIKLS